MRHPILLLVFAGLTATTPALAEKPDWAGKGKPSAEQKAAHRNAMEAKSGENDDIDAEKPDAEDQDRGEQARDRDRLHQPGDTAAMEKQRQKKSEQAQKELDKGSEQGQESRQQRRKWWRFWE